jgi:DNA-binding CsgD family transcriptional regulator
MHEPNDVAPRPDALESEQAVQEALRAHRWLLDAMLRQFPNGSINVLDRDLRYLYAAGRGLERAGLAPDSLIGRRLIDLYPADSVAYVGPSYARALAGETVVFDLSVFGRTYTIHASPLREPRGGVVAIVAIAQEAPTQPLSTGALTPRQREVAALIAAGLTNEQIAHRLVITAGTAANHVEQILRRLELHSRTQVATWAVERGLYSSAWGDEPDQANEPSRWPGRGERRDLHGRDDPDVP